MEILKEIEIKYNFSNSELDRRQIRNFFPLHSNVSFRALGRTKNEIVIRYNRGSYRVNNPRCFSRANRPFWETLVSWVFNATTMTSPTEPYSHDNNTVPGVSVY